MGTRPATCPVPFPGACGAFPGAGPGLGQNLCFSRQVILSKRVRCYHSSASHGSQALKEAVVAPQGTRDGLCRPPAGGAQRCCQTTHSAKHGPTAQTYVAQYVCGASAERPYSRAAYFAPTSPTVFGSRGAPGSRFS